MRFSDFLLTFMSIIFEALPFIVIGAVISGTLEELLPQKFFARWLPKNRPLAITLSSLFGMVLPMCECGIVPVMKRLLSKGVPPSCAIAYMLSAPVINPIVLTSTAMAFWTPEFTMLGVPGLVMVLLRAGGAFVTAFTVGLIIERMTKAGVEVVRRDTTRVRLIESDESVRLLQEDQTPKHDHTNCDHDHCDHEQGHDHHLDDEHHHHEHDHGHDHPGHAGHDHPHDHAASKRSLLDRLTAIADIAISDFLDITAFLVIGAALAAGVRTFLSTDQLDTVAGYGTLSIVAMMLLAYVLSLCSEADAFVAANFTSFSVGSKLAFLVLGPMLDIKLTIMYHWVFTRKAIRTIILTLLVTVFVISQASDLIGSLVPAGKPAASLSGGAR